MLRELLHGFVAQTAETAPEGSAFMSLLPLIAIFGVFYFLIIRPQQKTQRQQQDYLGQLKKGDEVILQNGIFGKVFSVGAVDAMIEISPGVKVRVLKAGITGPAGAAGQTADGKTDGKVEEKKG